MTNKETDIPVIYERFGDPRDLERSKRREPQASTAPGYMLIDPVSSSVNGKASWYCKAGVSVCHYKYPPGSMVAAACAKLRAAMGSKWRGKTVTVTRIETGKTVQVKLVDWCGSKDKTIDLYWEPMRRLGGTGVLRVKVSW